jgi:hypothetical protein
MLVYDVRLHVRRSFHYSLQVSNGEDTQQFAPSDYVDISASELKLASGLHAHGTQAPISFTRYKT